MMLIHGVGGCMKKKTLTPMGHLQQAFGRLQSLHIEI